MHIETDDVTARSQDSLTSERSGEACATRWLWGSWFARVPAADKNRRQQTANERAFADTEATWRSL
jgi:hypothetical protein